MTSLRAIVKGIAEGGLARWGPAILSRHLRRHRAVVLAYHNIVPAGCTPSGDLSLHLSQSSFAAQLDILRETHEVVPLEEIMSPANGRKPRAAITFDDAYRGALTAGLRELHARRLPATVFVAPLFVGSGTFWWDELAGEDGLDAGIRDEALARLGGDHAAVMEWGRATGCEVQRVPDYATVASEAELQAAVQTGLIKLGSHTWAHPNLASIADTERLTVELTQPNDWLRERFAGVAMPWLAYPYGLSDANVRSVAAGCKYDAGLQITGGCFDPGDPALDRFAIPRLNVPAGVSANGFRIRISGIFKQ